MNWLLALGLVLAGAIVGFIVGGFVAREVRTIAWYKLAQPFVIAIVTILISSWVAWKTASLQVETLRLSNVQQLEAAQQQRRLTFLRDQVPLIKPGISWMIDIRDDMLAFIYKLPHIENIDEPAKFPARELIDIMSGAKDRLRRMPRLPETVSWSAEVKRDALLNCLDTVLNMVKTFSSEQQANISTVVVQDGRHLNDALRCLKERYNWSDEFGELIQLLGDGPSELLSLQRVVEPSTSKPVSNATR